MPEPAREPPLPWEGYETWRHVPELAQLPPAQAGEIYRKIRDRVWLQRQMWRDFLPWLLGALAVFLLGSSLWRWIPVLRGPPRVPGLFRALTSTLFLIGTGLPTLKHANTVTRRALGRLARIELGAQCPTCDYDLRATPGRCPECGTGPDSSDGISD